jgi:rRNA small subunit pseudouridine methyltransferase Nep1
MSSSSSKRIKLSGAHPDAIEVHTVQESKSLLVPDSPDQKSTGERIIVVLEKAPLELLQGRNKSIELVNCDDHKNQLQKAGKDFSRFRPDILHQCLLTLLDSPLNKSGKLLIYIHTENHVLIEVSPMLRIPRTFKRFSGLFSELLQKNKIRAANSNDLLLKVIQNPIEKYLPPGGKKFGFSVAGKLTNIHQLVKDLITPTSSTPSPSSPPYIPITFVIGAVSTDDPVTESKFGAAYVEENISISNYSLSAACCCGKLCEAFEQVWNVL